MAVELRVPEMTKEQIAYLRKNSAKIPQPRPFQLYLQEDQLPPGTTYEQVYRKLPSELGFHIDDYGKPVMPWDYNPECLKEMKPKIEYIHYQKDSQSSFMVLESGEVRLPRQLNREDFGSGLAGQSAFNAMMFGKGCERFIDIEKRELCGNEPTHVLDFDVMADLEQRLVCSDLCRQEIMAKVDKDLAQMGRYTAFGINGFGRA